jgi:hypothetical protein
MYMWRTEMKTEMTDKEFLDKWEAECTERMLGGCITQHCWLEDSAKTMTRHAGSWAVTVRVEDMFRLIDIARSEK